MRQFIISEEDLKDFIRTSKLYGFACECVFYSPSEEELEATEENLKRYKELNEYIKKHRDEILQDNAEGGYYDINEDFKEIIEKLKKLDINISNLIQIYDNHRIEGKDFDLVYYTRLHIKKCIKNIESLSFLKGI